MRLNATIAIVLLFFAVTLTSCTQVSVTGPCEVQSDSSITLDVEWGVGSSGLAPASTLVSGGVAQRVAVAMPGTKASGVRPRNVEVQAENDSVLIVMEVPDSWTAGASSGDINGNAATVVASDTAPYCADSFGAVRGGYVRRFFTVSRGTPLVDGDGGTLHVTFATATVAEGVYHPAVFVTPETADGTNCVASSAFHRVVAGAPQFVSFDVSSQFNADLVVNDGDSTQDTLFTITSASSTAHLTFGTASFLGDGFGMPDDGLITPSTLETQLAALGIPVLVDRPECLPSMQLGFSNASNGNNAWVQQAIDEELTFSVPPARYAEVILLVTPGAGDLGDGLTPESLLRGMGVTLTYSDTTTTEVATLLPIFGLPFGFSAFSLVGIDPGIAGIVPSVGMAMGPVVPSDGSPGTPDTSELLAGITAVMVTPDSTKTLVSVTILPLVPSPPQVVSARTAAIRPAAVDPVGLAFFGAAGMQLPEAAEANLAVSKSLLTGGVLRVGDNLTYRVTVTNDGTADSTAVTMTDTLPSQVSWVSSTPSAGSCSFAAGAVTCNLGVLAPGASATVDIVATIVQAGTFDNTGAASMAGGETNTADNSATASAVVLPANAAVVPTLSEWSLGLLALALALAALLRLRA